MHFIEFNYYTFSLLFGCFTALISAVVVIIHNPKRLENISWFALGIATSIWSLGYLFLISFSDKQNLYTIALILHIAAILIPLLYFFFVIIITESFRVKIVRFFTYLFGIFAIFFLSISNSAVFIADLEPRAGIKHVVIPGLFYPMFFAYYSTVVLTGLIVTWITAKNTKDKVFRLRLIYTMIFTVFAAVGGGSTFLPAFFPNVPPFLLILFSVYPAISFYTIAKHQLFNIRLIAVQFIFFGLWVFILLRAILSENLREFTLEFSILIGSVVFGIIIIRGVLNEIKHREQLSILNLTLSDKVAEQTVEIRKSLEAEKHARMELEKLNDAKDQFIMITQHHLRTPVTSINWALEESLNGTYGRINKELKAVLEDSFASGKRLMGIVNDFLNITAIKVGTNILTLTTRSLLPSIEDILAELRQSIEKMDIHISYPRSEHEWPELKLDHDKIRESLFIVIENAVKYNQEGGSIAIKPTVQGHDFILAIENTGIGIDHEESTKIGTSLFYRGTEARKNNPIGMGIGLSVVKAMIRAHKGTFTIESKGRKEGALVTITLPLT